MDDKQISGEQQVRIAEIIAELKTWTTEARLEVFGAFCCHCGSDDPGCYCTYESRWDGD